MPGDDDFTLATISVASTIPLTMSASLTGRTGGLSTITRSECCSIEVTTSRARLGRAIRRGLVLAVRPRARRGSAAPGTGWSASTTQDSPKSTEVKPMSLARPKNSWIRGRRRSQPTIVTFRPAWANATERLANIVVLPSPGCGSRDLDARELAVDGEELDRRAQRSVCLRPG